MFRIIFVAMLHVFSNLFTMSYDSEGKESYNNNGVQDKKKVRETHLSVHRFWFLSDGDNLLPPPRWQVTLVQLQDK